MRQLIPCIHHSITKVIFPNIQAKLFLTILYVCPLTLESTDNLKNKLYSSLVMPFNDLNVSIKFPLFFVLVMIAILTETICSYSLSLHTHKSFCSPFLYSFQNFSILLMIRRPSLYALLQSRSHQGFIKPHNNSSILTFNISFNHTYNTIRFFCCN